ncbi:transcriptional regulator ['Osedax' symbiont bacterium Rs2_46_30_T18]|nr:transcriptional regulator ['Osedax' symbiont bacterium Rs2_46_30_T18]
MSSNKKASVKSKVKSKAPAVDSSILMLDLLASTSYPLTLSELCSQTGIPLASGHRIISVLLQQQMVARDPSRKKSYCIGSKIFQIASTVYNKQTIIPFFYPIAEILKNELHKSVFLCVPVGNKVVVISKVESSINQTIDLFIGQTLTMHCCAPGLAILSMYSPQTRQSYLDNEKNYNPDIDLQLEDVEQNLARSKLLGYAVVEDQQDAQVSRIAAPILNLRNEPVAAIGIAINSEGLSPQISRSYSKNLIQAARQLSSRII